MEAITAQKSLIEAVDLGLISADQVQPMLNQYNEDQIKEILEELVSAQMSPGMQCSGDHCSIF